MYSYTSSDDYDLLQTQRAFGNVPLIYSPSVLEIMSLSKKLYDFGLVDEHNRMIFSFDPFEDCKFLFLDLLLLLQAIYITSRNIEPFIAFGTSLYLSLACADNDIVATTIVTSDMICEMLEGDPEEKKEIVELQSTIVFALTLLVHFHNGGTDGIEEWCRRSGNYCSHS